jgi:hypothetical protein
MALLFCHKCLRAQRVHINSSRMQVDSFVEMDHPQPQPKTEEEMHRTLAKYEDLEKNGFNKYDSVYRNNIYTDEKSDSTSSDHIRSYMDLPQESVALTNPRGKRRWQRLADARVRSTGIEHERMPQITAEKLYRRANNFVKQLDPAFKVHLIHLHSSYSSNSSHLSHSSHLFINAGGKGVHGHSRKLFEFYKDRVKDCGYCCVGGACQQSRNEKCGIWCHRYIPTYRDCQSLSQK